MQNVHMLNMLIENLKLQKMLERPCFIVMNTANLERIAHLTEVLKKDGHIFSGADWCELDAVYMVHLEDDTNEQA